MFVHPNKPSRLRRLELADEFDLSEWLVQPKWNGIRVIIIHDGDVQVLNRYGKPVADFRRIPMIKALPLPKPFMLDGELLPDGRIIIWDAPVLGEKWFHEPYSARLDRLKALWPRMRMVGIELIETRRGAFWKRLWLSITQGKSPKNRKNTPGKIPEIGKIEGVVFKKKDGTDFWSFSGRSRDVTSQFKYRLDYE